MNRRSFMRSLGGAVAAAMLPFTPAIRLSAPKKAKATRLLPFWFQTTRGNSFYSAEYKAYLEKLMVDAGGNPNYKAPDSLVSFMIKGA